LRYKGIECWDKCWDERELSVGMERLFVGCTTIEDGGCIRKEMYDSLLSHPNTYILAGHV
jgi:hypothetical protein